MQHNSPEMLAEQLVLTETRLRLMKRWTWGFILKWKYTSKPRKWFLSLLLTPLTHVNSPYCRDKGCAHPLGNTVRRHVQQDSFTFRFIRVSSFHNSFNIWKLSGAVSGLLSLSPILYPAHADLLHYFTTKAQDCPSHHREHFNRGAQKVNSWKRGFPNAKSDSTEPCLSTVSTCQ